MIDIMKSIKDLNIELHAFQKGIVIGCAPAKHVTAAVKWVALATGLVVKVLLLRD